VYSYIALSTTYSGCSYEPSSGWLVFLSKVKYTISNAIVIVTYDLVGNNNNNIANWIFTLLTKSNKPEDGS
jgi:hypothetical protein